MRIFISYRRDDSAFESTVICEALQKSFGKRRVFMDVDGIPLGADFSLHIGQDNQDAQRVESNRYECIARHSQLLPRRQVRMVSAARRFVWPQFHSRDLRSHSPTC